MRRSERGDVKEKAGQVIDDEALERRHLHSGTLANRIHGGTVESAGTKRVRQLGHERALASAG